MINHRSAVATQSLAAIALVLVSALLVTAAPSRVEAASVRFTLPAENAMPAPLLSVPFPSDLYFDQGQPGDGDGTLLDHVTLYYGAGMSTGNHVPENLPLVLVGDVGAKPGRLRIAFTDQAPTGAPVHRDCVHAVHDAAALCEQLGHAVAEAAPPLNGRLLESAYITVASSGFLWAVEDWARRTGRTPRAQDFEPATWTYLERARRRSAADYLLAVQDLQRIARQVAGPARRESLRDHREQRRAEHDQGDRPQRRLAEDQAEPGDHLAQHCDYVGAHARPSMKASVCRRAASQSRSRGAMSRSGFWHVMLVMT